MLYHDFLTNDQRTIHKWLHYFPIYEKFFNKFINNSVTLWEIGVFKGGSLQMWKRYLGPFAIIVGIDIDSRCKTVEENQIHVRTGDQSDTKFLQSVIDEFGAPDIVIDDGSHRDKDIYTTFNFLYEKVSKNGIYLVEDLHALYMDGTGNDLKDKMEFIDLCKELTECFSDCGHNGCRGRFFEMTYSMSFYDSVAVFQKAERMKGKQGKI
ncbi:MAG: class I SAM-dependent methyltransferase [Synergistaceae bacterium]|jgi:23S rRNA U2552 (ribose-2'-O)-methylase RlmE/FtsJ|nr:class I SAM-dependent methyltransferase [Synergistaceae bacterium]